MEYKFQQVNSKEAGPLQDNSALLSRPFTAFNNTFERDARRFVPGSELETAINTALAVGSPLLITGEPGTGKTQSAYYTAYKLNVEPVLHFQVKSDSSASDLLYYFDAVRYFHDANLPGEPRREIDKNDYIEKRVLWQAFESPMPRVVIIDEIDKAPRDFPNDLLLELDKMEFTVSETQLSVRAEPAKRPIVFITSNSERRLPEPFLRRCVYHHIRFDEHILREAIDNRRSEYLPLSEGFIKLALQRFLALRDKPLRKRPSTGEFIVWLRVLAASVGTYPENLDENLSGLPFLGTLLKDQQDIAELGTNSRN